MRLMPHIEERIATNKNITISDTDLIHQWRSVFRLKAGDRVVLLDNYGFEYEAEIVSLEKSEARVSIKESRTNTVVPSKELFLLNKEYFQPCYCSFFNEHLLRFNNTIIH